MAWTAATRTVGNSVTARTVANRCRGWAGAPRRSRRAAARPAQGFAREGDPRAVRGGRPLGPAQLERRLQGDDRRPPRRRRPHPAPAGDPDLRRRRACSTSASPAATGSRRPAATSSPSASCTTRRPRRTPFRIVVAVPAGLARGTRSRTCPQGVRVSSEYPALTRRFFAERGHRRRRPAVLRRHRGEGPRHRRLRRRRHRDRPGAAGRRAEDHRRDPAELHRAHRQPRAPTTTRPSATPCSSSRRCSTACSRPGARCS